MQTQVYYALTYQYKRIYDDVTVVESLTHREYI